MKSFLIISLIVMVIAGPVGAQTIIMKDGRMVVAKALRRQGDVIMANQDIPGAVGQAPATGELGYPLSQISRIEFPEPAQLEAATDLITQGKANDAIAQLDTALRYYEGFRDAPGSWWADLSLIKVTALNSLGRVQEGDALVDQIARLATDPETIRAAKAQMAASMARRGEHKRALEICDSILKESDNPDTLAVVAISKGECHLALKQWEPALLSFLQIPVFHSDVKLLQPPAMLGSGRAYAGIDDLSRAKETLKELIATYGASAEAASAKTELEKIARLEKALEPPN